MPSDDSPAVCAEGVAPFQTGAGGRGVRGAVGEARGLPLGWPHVCQGTCSRAGSGVIVRICLAAVESANTVKRRQVSGGVCRSGGAEQPQAWEVARSWSMQGDGQDRVAGRGARALVWEPSLWGEAANQRRRRAHPSQAVWPLPSRRRQPPGEGHTQRLFSTRGCGPGCRRKA